MTSRKTLIALGLALVTGLVYMQVAHFQFVIYDDPQYVYENRWIRYGLTADGVYRAFFTSMSANWHPVTWISHMLDVTLFGMEPGPQHLINVGIHMLNVVLLFKLLVDMTGATWRSAFVAALFGIHPLHVESVAWISERKDLLCAMFGFLAVGQYLAYVRLGSRRRYAAMSGILVLALMSKPMLVTFPFLLLLLDYWPLGRFGRISIEAGEPFRASVLEKIPLMGFTVASSLLTLWAQTRGEAIVPVDAFPVWARTCNALTAYAKYFGKMVWPVSLAVFYPNPGLVLTPWKVAAAGLFLSIVTYAVLRHAGERRYLPVGWFWFLGMMIPVIGLVQVGSQAMADRYSYLPLIGLFIAATWGISDLRERFKWPVSIPAVSGALCLAVLSVITWRQVGYWRNNYTLFGHMLEVVPKWNRLAHINLGGSFLNDGDPSSAVGHFALALKEAPGDEMANWGMGVACRMLGRLDEAVSFYRAVLKLNPRNSEARLSLGLTLIDSGKSEDGYRQLEAIAASGRDDDRFVLVAEGMVLAHAGRPDEGIRRMQEALVYAPNDLLTNMKLGILMARNGRYPDAAECFSAVVRFSPKDAVAYYNLALSQEHMGAIREAIVNYEMAASLRPGDVEILGNLGIALGKLGRYDQAVARFREALLIDPRNAVARNNLSLALALKGRR